MDTLTEQIHPITRWRAEHRLRPEQAAAALRISVATLRTLERGQGPLPRWDAVRAAEAQYPGLIPRLEAWVDRAR